MFNLIKQTLGGGQRKSSQDSSGSDKETVTKKATEANGVHETQAGVNGVTENFDKETGNMVTSVYHDTKEDAASESPKTALTSPERTARIDSGPSRSPSPEIKMVRPRGVDESTDSEGEDESEQLTDGRKLQEHVPTDPTAPDAPGLRSPPASEVTHDSTDTQTDDEEVQDNLDEDVCEAEQPSDEDKDPRNPKYVPRDPRYYMHDTREDMSEPADTAAVYAAADAAALKSSTEAIDQQNADAAEREERRARKARSDIDKWAHDMYDEQQQTPISADEIVRNYNIRDENKASAEGGGEKHNAAQPRQQQRRRRQPRQFAGTRRGPPPQQQRQQRTTRKKQERTEVVEQEKEAPKKEAPQGRKAIRSKNRTKMPRQAIGDTEEVSDEPVPRQRQQAQSSRRTTVTRRYPRPRPDSALRNARRTSRDDRTQYAGAEEESIRRPYRGRGRVRGRVNYWRSRQQYDGNDYGGIELNRERYEQQPPQSFSRGRGRGYEKLAYQQQRFIRGRGYDRSGYGRGGYNRQRHQEEEVYDEYKEPVRGSYQRGRGRGGGTRVFNNRRGAYNRQYQRQPPQHEEEYYDPPKREERPQRQQRVQSQQYSNDVRQDRSSGRTTKRYTQQRNEPTTAATRSASDYRAVPPPRQYQEEFPPLPGSQAPREESAASKNQKAPQSHREQQQASSVPTQQRQETSKCQPPSTNQQMNIGSRPVAQTAPVQHQVVDLSKPPPTFTQTAIPNVIYPSVGTAPPVPQVHMPMRPKQPTDAVYFDPKQQQQTPRQIVREKRILRIDKPNQ